MNKPARSNVLPLEQEMPTRNHASAAAPAERAKGRKRRLNGRHLLLAGFTAWAAYVFFFVQAPNLERLKQSEQQLDAEIRAAQETGQELQERIEKLQDPAYIAEIARKKYYMVKEGETLFVQPKP
jgi:cell division protein DivIC